MPVSAPGAKASGNGRFLLGLFGLLALLGAGASVMHGRGSLAPPVAPSPSPAPAAAPHTPDDRLPNRSKFAGSAACADCHKKKHARWSPSWHARALAEARRGAVVGSFGGVRFKGDSSEAWMTHSGERFFMRTRDREGRLGDYRVDWVIGGKRMQDPLTVLPDGRWQVLPVYFHVTSGRLGRLQRGQAGDRRAGPSLLLDQLPPDGQPRVPGLPHDGPGRALRPGKPPLVHGLRGRGRGLRELPRPRRSPRRDHGQARHRPSPQSRGRGGARHLRPVPRAAEPALPHPGRGPSLPARRQLRRKVPGFRRDGRAPALAGLLPGRPPQELQLRVPGPPAVRLLPQGRRHLPELPHGASRGARPRRPEAG